MRAHQTYKNAFSLVELSIVLVILGLLTGGILAGQSLIRASEIRSVSTDLGRYYAATQSFRDKYFGLPGDVINATSFWGDQATGTGACASASTPDGTPGTCDGNGNGRLGQLNAEPFAENTEMFRYWQQLALAGLIEGSFSGVTGSGSTREALIGTNVPKSRVSNAGYTMGYIPASGWLSRSDNYIYAGGTIVAAPTWSPFLKPEELWNLDSKMDDGRPGRGAILSSEPACNTTVSPDTSDYNLSNSAVACALLAAMGV